MKEKEKKQEKRKKEEKQEKQEGAEKREGWQEGQNREWISEAVGGIQESYLKEAELFFSEENVIEKEKNRERGKDKKEERKNRADRQFWSVSGARKRRKRGRMLAAAALTGCLLAGGAGALLTAIGTLPFGRWEEKADFPFGERTVKAYAYGTNQELNEAGVVMDTGSIRDDGEQTGHPLMFYLSGSQIESVRFSCEKEQLFFTDWTEQREEYGLAGNFTVPYGEKEEEYYYLTIEWEPNEILEALKEKKSIAALPKELREDRIVMEITFADGQTAVKAIWISLLDDGRFFAVFGDDTIQEEDTFVRRTDALSLREQSEQKLSQLKEQERKKAEQEQNRQENGEQNSEKEICVDPKAEEAARTYYDGTVWEVVSMEAISSTENQVVFSVCASRGGILQEPNRTITVELREGSWEVTGEGY